MTLRIKLLAVILIGISVSFTLFLFRESNSQKTYKICFKDYCFKVKIADTPQERAGGLMYKTSLKENEGMLFVFNKPGIYGFWMKNTLIPLDIIWLDENYKVVYIKENVQPCLNENCPIFKNSRPAYVLEITGGVAKKLQIKIGEQLERKSITPAH